MKQNKWMRLIALCLCLTLAAGLMAGCGSKQDDAQDAGEETGKTAETTAADSGEEIAAEPTVNRSTGDALCKDETVYVLCGSDGQVSKVIVSDWLKNGTKQDSIDDETALQDVTAVKGNTTYTMGGKTAVWDAQGGDVYYQGTSDEPLPVDVSVQYTLDGKDIDAASLAGQSGHVTMRFNYKNNQSQQVTIDGKKETIYVPFVMMTGVLLNRDKFENVKVSNGKLVELGDQTAVLGFALPGLQENLGGDADELDLPDYVEIEADVTDFAMDTTMTMASSEMFCDLDLDKADESIDELRDSMSQLTDGMDQLLDGSSELYEKLGTLLDSSETLVDAIYQVADATKTLDGYGVSLRDGTATLSSGVNQLAGGLQTITLNNDTLNAGAQQAFQTLLDTANKQLASAGLEQLGITVPTLTVSNYSETLNSLIEQLSEDNVRAYATAQARSQVEATVQASEEQIRQGVTQAVQTQVRAAVEPQVRQSVEQAVTKTVHDSIYNAAYEAIKAQYAAAGADVTDETVLAAIEKAATETTEQTMQTEETQKTISDNVEAQMSSAEVAATIDSLVQQQMATEEMQQTIAQNVAAQEQALIEQNMAGETVQAAIAQAIASAKAGSAQLQELLDGLKQYQQFADGLSAYTGGVATVQINVGSLQTGATQIAGYMAQVSEGLAQLDAATAQLAEASSALPDAVEQFQDGAMQLSEGLQELNEQGIEKLSSFVNGDLASLKARLQAICDVAKAYTNYSGIADGMDGKVRFVYKTEAIGDSDF